MSVVRALLLPNIVLDNQQIDRDHEIFIAIVNEISNAIVGRNSQRLRYLVVALGAYADAHFENEEELMADYGYAEAEAHRAEHEWARAQISELSTAVQKDPAAASRLLEFLHEWLERHIDTTDRRLAETLNRH